MPFDVAVAGRLEAKHSPLARPFGRNVGEVSAPMPWERVPSIAATPLARDHMGIAVIDGKIHIVGGRTGGQTDNVRDHDVYDPATDQCRVARQSTICRRRDPNAKCGGGEDFDENEAYDPKSNTWLTLAKLPSGRQVFGAATDGSAAYFPVGTLRCGCLHCSTTCGMDIPRGRK